MHADIFDAQGAGIPANEFLRRPREDDNDLYFAAIRWAVVLDDNDRASWYRSRGYLVLPQPSTGSQP
jgi:hypothetical protein